MRKKDIIKEYERITFTKMKGPTKRTRKELEKVLNYTKKLMKY